MDTVSSSDLMERQYALEEDMVCLGIDRYRTNYNKAMQEHRFGDTHPGTILTKLSLEKFAEAISEWKNEALSGKPGRRNRSALSINELDPFAVAYVSIKTIFSKLYRRNSLNSLAIAVGKAVMDEARFEEFKRVKPALFNQIDLTAKKNGQTPERRRATLIYSMNKFSVDFEEWTKTAKLHLGVKMIEIYAEISGFISVGREQASGKGWQYVVLPTQAVLDFVEKRNGTGEVMRPVFLPSVIKPLSWSPETFTNGAYHFGMQTKPIPMVNNRPDNGVKYAEAMDMPEVYQALNAIQDTPWRVNTRIFEVIKRMWDHNMDVPGIPSRKNIPVPDYPIDATDDEVKREWRRRAREVHDLNAQSMGKRLSIDMSLSLAERMIKDEEIFFPHNLDFRGRAYCITGCLSPQGSDYSRALIEFAHGERLGDDSAARWLAIHGANVFGEDKVSLEHRVNWVQEHEEEILWCAEDPYKFDWWTQADKPFCFLAFCFEWQGYYRKGFDHVCHMPVALDGTCNGLQHFSAMLRDSVGAKHVNLVPNELPQDIYGAVAEKVNEYLSGTFEDGKEALWAETWLAFGIDRSITKRSVMVLPYGGTFKSCRQYVGEKVREKLRERAANPFGDDQAQAVIFLAKLVWAALGETVIAARAAMKWLQKVARIVAKYDLPVEWTTPTGFRVKQKYMKQDNRRVKTQLYGDITYLSFKEITDKLSPHKQGSAVSPNFVHSLDSSAMMMTVCMALDEGITNFAMIHDSYGTLPSQTDTLARTIRRAFVKLYTEHDVLEEFREDVLEYLPKEAHDEIPPLPAKGNLILEDVLDSEFFFS